MGMQTNDPSYEASDKMDVSEHTTCRLSGMPVLLLDGGMGTYLEEAFGIVFDDSMPAWSASVDTAQLRTVHDEYLRAGADIVLTSTYQADLTTVLVPPQSSENGEEITQNYEYLSKAKARLCGLVDVAAQSIESFVNNASQNSGRSKQAPAVALSIGAYGGCMKPSTEYTGDYPDGMRMPEELAKNYLWRLEPFLDESDRLRSSGRQESSMENTHVTHKPWSSISYVAFETLVGVNDVLGARRAMAELSSQLRDSTNGCQIKSYWICVNYPDKWEGGLHAPCGDSAEAIASAMVQEGLELGEQPWGIGINCTKLQKIAPLAKSYEVALDRKFGSDAGSQAWPWLIVYPDGAQNLRYNPNTKQWDPISSTDGTLCAESAINWSSQILQIIQEIASRGRWSGIVVGGCCKTNPRDIALLRGLLDKAAD